MLNINLVPEVRKEQAKVKKTNLAVTTVAIIVGTILLAAVLILGSILGYRSAKIASVDKNIVKTENELKAYKDLEDSVVTLENGLIDIKQITSGGRNWTDFYEEIEKATPADTQFVTFKVTGNAVSADIKGKDVKSIDRFMKSFANYKDSDGNDMFSGVTVDGYTTKDNGEVSFQAKFEVVGATK